MGCLFGLLLLGFFVLRQQELSFCSIFTRVLLKTCSSSYLTFLFIFTSILSNRFLDSFCLMLLCYTIQTKPLQKTFIALRRNLKKNVLLYLQKVITSSNVILTFCCRKVAILFPHDNCYFVRPFLMTYFKGTNKCFLIFHSAVDKTLKAYPKCQIPSCFFTVFVLRALLAVPFSALCVL